MFTQMTAGELVAHAILLAWLPTLAQFPAFIRQ
jgi:hypothetical protein